MLADKLELLWSLRHGFVLGDGEFDTPARCKACAPHQLHKGRL